MSGRTPDEVTALIDLLVKGKRDSCSAMDIEREMTERHARLIAANSSHHRPSITAQGREASAMYMTKKREFSRGTVPMSASQCTFCPRTLQSHDNKVVSRDEVFLRLVKKKKPQPTTRQIPQAKPPPVLKRPVDEIVARLTRATTPRVHKKESMCTFQPVLNLSAVTRARSRSTGQEASERLYSPRRVENTPVVPLKAKDAHNGECSFTPRVNPTKKWGRNVSQTPVFSRLSASARRHEERMSPKNIAGSSSPREWLEEVEPCEFFEEIYVRARPTQTWETSSFQSL